MGRCHIGRFCVNAAKVNAFVFLLRLTVCQGVSVKPQSTFTNIQIFAFELIHTHVNLQNDIKIMDCSFKVFNGAQKIVLKNLSAMLIKY